MTNGKVLYGFLSLIAGESKLTVHKLKAHPPKVFLYNTRLVQGKECYDRFLER